MARQLPMQFASLIHEELDTEGATHNIYSDRANAHMKQTQSKYSLLAPSRTDLQRQNPAQPILLNQLL